MARHNEILLQFKEITPEFDYSNKAHVNLVRIIGLIAYTSIFVYFYYIFVIIKKARNKPVILISNILTVSLYSSAWY